MPDGRLFLCATPIGNLEDITMRVLRILREVDSIWAEDTRHTLQLLNHYGIRKPLLSCHEHNEQARARELVQELRAGRNIAYCSDAGMPGISDPGARLVAACYEYGLPVTALPGASAVLLCAVLSGIECAQFTFYGFLPREKKQRRAQLEALRSSTVAMILYESPMRIPATLRELMETLGKDRPAAVLRELTKVHETVLRGTLETLCDHFCEPPRGECVLVLAGREKETPAEPEEEALDAALLGLMREGFSTRDAAKATALLLPLPRKRAYQRALYLEQTRPDEE